MSAIPYEEDREQDWEDRKDPTLMLPGRRRRQFFNRRSAALVAVIACAAGFYAGIRVEKGQVSSSPTSATRFTLPTAARAGAGASATSGRSGARGTDGFPAGGAGFPTAALGGGSASIGTISSVAGHTIYLSEGSGNTVKVTVSSATKVTKSLSVSKHSLRPGDSVVIRGVSDRAGTIAAGSVSDSGASGTVTGGSGTGNASASGGSSAVNSLFGSGSGG